MQPASISFAICGLRRIIIVFSLFQTNKMENGNGNGKKLSRLGGRLGQVDRVPRLGGLPCLACKRFDASSKETYEELALPG